MSVGPGNERLWLFGPCQRGALGAGYIFVGEKFAGILHASLIIRSGSTGSVAS